MFDSVKKIYQNKFNDVGYPNFENYNTILNKFEFENYPFMKIVFGKRSRNIILFLFYFHKLFLHIFINKSINYCHIQI